MALTDSSIASLALCRQPLITEPAMLRPAQRFQSTRAFINLKRGLIPLCTSDSSRWQPVLAGCQPNRTHCAIPAGCQPVRAHCMLVSKLSSVCSSSWMPARLSWQRQLPGQMLHTRRLCLTSPKSGSRTDRLNLTGVHLVILQCDSSLGWC